VRKMMELFIETVPLNLKDLNVSLDNENWEMVSKTAHKLKSTIDSMGIISIKEDIRIVELNAKKKESLTNVPVHIRKINDVIDACIRQLESELSHQLQVPE
jgi:HPt (histidine-containing phosphotransfer) domain-containing protein